MEEKLDGANVALWMDAGVVTAGSRGGSDSMDRAGQLGRLRAWAAEHDRDLRGLLSDGTVLYGEWLWLTHSVYYDHLPDWLVVLDLLQRGDTWASPADRDQAAHLAGFTPRPWCTRAPSAAQNDF